MQLGLRLFAKSAGGVRIRLARSKEGVRRQAAPSVDSRSHARCKCCYSVKNSKKRAKCCAVRARGPCLSCLLFHRTAGRSSAPLSRTDSCSSAGRWLYAPLCDVLPFVWFAGEHCCSKTQRGRDDIRLARLRERDCSLSGEMAPAPSVRRCSLKRLIERKLPADGGLLLATQTRSVHRFEKRAAKEVSSLCLRDCKLNLIWHSMYMTLHYIV